MIISLVLLAVGLAVFGGGLYYLVKEKEDPESRKIYTVATAIGALITIGVIIKIIAFGL